MKKLLIISVLLFGITSCKQQEEVNLEFVLKNFKEHSNAIRKIEYDAVRIDTFPNSNKVQNNSGYVLMERDTNDKTFGFSFFAKRLDHPVYSMYDKGRGYEINSETRSYTVNKNPGLNFMNSPSGDMVSSHMFILDSTYKSGELIIYPEKYIITYRFENDTVFDFTDIKRILEIDKKTFLPLKVTQSLLYSGNKSVQQINLSNIRINYEVKGSISDYKQKLNDYIKVDVAEKEVDDYIPLQEIPDISLPDLFDCNNIINLKKSNKLTLIEFWDPWCGYCVKSLPEVEKLRNMYMGKLRVIGIVTKNLVASRKIIGKKRISFQNLAANREVINKFNLQGYPTFFLVDSIGNITNVYIGFAMEDIMKDIENLIGGNM